MKSTLLGTFVLMGMNYLLPFNTFINSFDYFIHHVSNLPVEPRTFALLVNVTYQISAVLFNILSILKILLMTNQERTIGTISVLLSAFLIIATATLVWTGADSYVFFSLTLLFSLLISASQSIFDNINLYYSGLLKGEKTVLAYSAGINLSGTIHSLVLLTLGAIAHNANATSVISCYYLITAGLLLLSLIGYKILTWTIKQQENRMDVEVLNLRNIALTVEELIPWNRTGWHYIAIVGFNFALTLFVFPALLIQMSQPWAYYNMVCVFLGFNVSALMGNLMAVKYRIILEGLYPILIFRAIITGFLVLIYLMGLPFNGIMPYLYTIIHLLFAFGSGYIASICYHRGSKLENGTENRILLLRSINLAVSIGLLFGTLMSLLLVHFSTK